jgi:hypothetical protein
MRVETTVNPFKKQNCLTRKHSSKITEKRLMEYVVNVHLVQNRFVESICEIRLLLQMGKNCAVDKNVWNRQRSKGGEATQAEREREMKRA